MNLTREQRDNRDQLSARGAIGMAKDEGKTVGIVVDDRHKAKRMEKRVRDIAKSMALDFRIERRGGVIDIHIGEGVVRIVPAVS